MFYLGGSDFPESREQLSQAVTEGLRALMTLPSARQVVAIEGDSFPALHSVVIDLSGAKANTERLPPEPKGIGQSRPAVSAARLEVKAHPLLVRNAPVELALSATDARFNYDKNADGRPLLLLEEARNGAVTLEIKKQDLESVLLTGAKEAAGKQGVQIQESHLTLSSIDDRSLNVEVRVKAKKMFLSATISLKGKLAIDDTLNATASGLTCSGEGMMGEMACNVLRPQLQKFDGRQISLTALSLGQVRLRDVRISVGDVLKISAAFGS